MRVMDMPPHDRPREKLFDKGAAYLTDAELLAIIIRSGTRGHSALQVASVLLSRHPLARWPSLAPRDLRRVRGIDTVKAAAVIALIELGKRIYPRLGEKAASVTRPEDTLILVSDIAASKKEHFVVIYLNARNHVILREVISIGMVNSSIVHPREVFEPAIRNVAAQMILVHNHPSGDPEPSDADITLTRRLCEVGKIMGIEIADHVIVAGTRYVSMREQGII